MRHRSRERLLRVLLFVCTITLVVLRVLFNEKGRVSPDAIRFMRQAAVFPQIDNTTTPLGYALSLKSISLLGPDIFWSSKIIGLLSLFGMLVFAIKKKYFSREVILTAALFSYVSIFSYTMSETLILPFVFVFLYVSRQIIIEQYQKWEGVLWLSIILILLYNIRYNALFFIVSCLLYGIWNYKKEFGKIFIASSGFGFLYILGYKILFIDIFNPQYFHEFLEIGIKPTSQLLQEFFIGITTTFNPFIHIAHPTSSIINAGIYFIGGTNIIVMIILFKKNSLSETEIFLVFTGITGIVCSYFIQYFYSVDALDYRLLSPFVLSIWLVYFKKLQQILGQKVFIISFMSICTGLAFTLLSKADYLPNRRMAKNFLLQNHLIDKEIVFFNNLDDEHKDEAQIAELLSTVNPKLYITTDSKDTLKVNVITLHKFESQVKIHKNKFQ